MASQAWAGGDVVERPEQRHGLDLEQALLLTRVSTMKMLRLQLAIERRDRGVALQAVDDLVEIDGWLANGLPEDLPARELAEAMALEVEEDRAALLHERLGLAAGLVRRASDETSKSFIEAEPAPKPLPEPEVAPVFPTESETQQPFDYLEGLEPEESAAVPRRGRGWIAFLVILVLVTAAICATMLLGWRPV